MLTADVVGCVGRLVPEKGVHVLLAALQHLPATVHGLIVGDGPLRSELEAQASSPELKGRVHFTGVAGPAAITVHMRRMRALAVPSLTMRWKSSGRVIAGPLCLRRADDQLGSGPFPVVGRAIIVPRTSRGPRPGRRVLFDDDIRNGSYNWGSSRRGRLSTDAMATRLVACAAGSWRLRCFARHHASIRSTGLAYRMPCSIIITAGAWAAVPDHPAKSRDVLVWQRVAAVPLARQLQDATAAVHISQRRRAVREISQRLVLGAVSPHVKACQPRRACRSVRGRWRLRHWSRLVETFAPHSRVSRSAAPGRWRSCSAGQRCVSVEVGQSAPMDPGHVGLDVRCGIFRVPDCRTSRATFS
jgi:hypothetical protein